MLNRMTAWVGVAVALGVSVVGGVFGREGGEPKTVRTFIPKARATTQTSTKLAATNFAVAARLADLNQVGPGHWKKLRSCGGVRVTLRVGEEQGVEQRQGKLGEARARGYASTTSFRVRLINAEFPLKVRVQFSHEDNDGTKCKIEQTVEITFAWAAICLRSDDGRFLLILDWSPVDPVVKAAPHGKPSGEN